MNRGIHSLPNNGKTNDWLTPPWLLKAIGPFDLDPCAHPKQPYRTATIMISPPNDGLSANWSGRVFLNPPYGQQLKHWISKLADHGNGIALVPSRTEVESWFVPYIWNAANAIFFIHGRLYFHTTDGKQAKGNAGHGSVLAVYGRSNLKKARNWKLNGRLIELNTQIREVVSELSQVAKS